MQVMARLPMILQITSARWLLITTQTHLTSWTSVDTQVCKVCYILLFLILIFMLTVSLKPVLFLPLVSGLEDRQKFISTYLSSTGFLLIGYILILPPGFINIKISFCLLITGLSLCLSCLTAFNVYLIIF